MFFSKLTNGFYSTEIHGGNMPHDAVEITQEEHQALLLGQSQGKTIGADKVGKPILITPPPPTKTELKAAQIQKINANFTDAMNALTGSYPVNEILSWHKQEAEARAYALNITAVTPLIDALSVARGVAKNDLVGRIIAKSNAFAAISGGLIGKRQALEGAVEALPTTASDTQINAINW